MYTAYVFIQCSRKVSNIDTAAGLALGKVDPEEQPEYPPFIHTMAGKSAINGGFNESIIHRMEI